MTTLDRADHRRLYRIARIGVPTQAPEWRDWLHELGFIPGETVCLMARAAGGDPLVIRVGSSTFALRMAEAACIAITPLEETRPA
jgi:ferrous iron transport protein A